MKVAQSCLTLCNPMDYTVHGILQARILEWVAYPFSSGSSRSRNQTQESPALQVDSLPSELSGKPWYCLGAAFLENTLGKCCVWPPGTGLVPSTMV